MRWLLLVLTLTPAGLSARIHLLLDDRLRKSDLEQVIYRFVPMTNATEVVLTYVRDFLEPENARVWMDKTPSADRAIYLGAERFPSDSRLNRWLKSKDFLTLVSKVYILVINDAPNFAALPRGLFAHEDLWRKFAELSQAKYAGFYNLHYLDNRPVKLNGFRPKSGHCVHESGVKTIPSVRGPIRFTREGFVLQYQKQAGMLTGDWVCINTPLADTIFQVRIARTDVLLSANTARFSAWNDAQNLPIKLQSDKQIYAPLALEIIPEVTRGETEFFFQGDRLICNSKRCGNKNTRFLLPQVNTLKSELEFAFRGNAGNYFRATLRLMSGELEVARTAVRLLPHSWVAEVQYALLNPSEYRLYFLLGVIGLIAVLTLTYFFCRLISRVFSQLKARYKKPPLPVQSSGVLQVQTGDVLSLTATNNPFGYELEGFGGIVRVAIAADGIEITHGGRSVQYGLSSFRHRLPDGYVLDFRPFAQKALLYLYRLNEKDLSSTSMISGQRPVYQNGLRR